MGRPLSVTLADIHMIRIEKDIVAPLKLIFYKRFVDDTLMSVLVHEIIMKMI